MEKANFAKKLLTQAKMANKKGRVASERICRARTRDIVI